MLLCHARSLLRDPHCDYKTLLNLQGSIPLCAVALSSLKRLRGHPGTARSHHESAEPSLLTSGSLKGVGGGGGGGGGAVVGGRAGFGLHIKAGDMTTVWWACVWLGRLRLYRNMVDPQPKVSFASTFSGPICLKLVCSCVCALRVGKGQPCLFIGVQREVKIDQ